MELIFKRPRRVYRFPAMAGVGGVTTLNYEAWDEAVEESTVVVTVKAVLEEVAGGEGGLFRKQFDEEVACGGGEEDFGGGLGLEIIEGGHSWDAWQDEVNRNRLFIASVHQARPLCHFGKKNEVLTQQSSLT